MSSPEVHTSLVKQLVALLEGGNAHATLAKAVDGFLAEFRGAVPGGLPYSAWQLVEHLRITQRDILEFSAPPPGGYKSRAWPADYWPSPSAPPDAESWNQSLAALRADQESFAALLTKPDVDLFEPFAWGDGQNLFREALLIADHNSYHTGELVVLRRLLGIWHT